MAGGFESLGLMPELIRAVNDMGWLLPSDVQDESIPLILGGGDVMVAAATGSGKTGAFALPILQLVHERRKDAKVRSKGPTVAAEEPVVGTCCMSMTDRDSGFTVSDSGFECGAMSTKRWSGGRATVGLKSGKAYFEMRVDECSGVCRVGWATKAASYDLGTDNRSYGYGGTAKKSHNRAFEDYGVTYGAGDTVGCFLDLQKGEISYSVNGEHRGVAFQLPAHFTNGKSAFYPAICVKNARVSVRFDRGNEGFPGLSCVPSHALEANETQNVEFTAAASVAGQKRGVSAIILEPARDLAEQVYSNIEEFKKFVSAPSIESVLLIGGDKHGKKVEQRVNNGNVDIIVGTPRRVEDLVKRNKIDVKSVQFFILDEADRFLETDDLEVIMSIFKKLPKGGTGIDRLQVCFFSATLHSDEISTMSSMICHEPTWVDLKGKDAVPETVHHLIVRVDPNEHYYTQMIGRMTDGEGPLPITDSTHRKGNLKGSVNLDSLSERDRLSEKIKMLKPRVLLELIDALDMDMCLLFCRTNLDCDLLEKFLIEAGGGQRAGGKENRYSCCVLAGMRSMEERRQNLHAFKQGDVRFLICTDVAARGIDVQGLPYVVNVTLPDKPENYIHRIGRVGRAEKMGLAVSLVSTVEERVWYCQNKLKPPQSDTRDYEKGGNCIWYNEPDLLQQVEARVKTKIAEIKPPSFSLPSELASTNYGENASNESTYMQDIKKHMSMLNADVVNLMQLETKAQQIWLRTHFTCGAPDISKDKASQIEQSPPKSRNQQVKHRGGRGNRGGKKKSKKAHGTSEPS